MPKTTITYRIFVGSPSDVDTEKNIIRTVVEELNNQNVIRNVKLEVIDWKSNTYPSIGNDAQDVINKQINDDFDIFIGIFWARFGAPTKRDTSGTKEEFEIAYNRHIQNPKSVHILMYFKTTPISIDDIDIEQISSLNLFKKSISDRGVLYSKFENPNEFEKLVRNHLIRLFGDLSIELEESLKENAKENQIIVLEKKIINEEELGYFEYLETGNRYMFAMQTELSKLTKQTKDLGSRLSKRTGQINALMGKPDAFIQKQSKKIINDSSGDLDIFNRNSAPLIPPINEYFNNSMLNFSKAFLIHRDYIKNDVQKQEIASIFRELRTSLVVAFEGISGLNNSIKTLPPLTTKLIKAKAETNLVMTEITTAFKSYINIVDDLLTTTLV